MKYLFLLSMFICTASSAQITISLSSRPSAGTSAYMSQLRLANAAGLTYATSGANKVWDFSTITADTNSLLEYKSPTAINPAFALSIPLTSFGYKILDSLPTGGFLPISIKDIYSFFQKKSSTNSYNAIGRGFFVSGFPLGSTYIDDDEIFYFPMTYNRYDSSTFEVNMSLATVGTLKQKGNRRTTVDGWGTIRTPKYPAGIPCLRVRSVVSEIDSVKIGTGPALPIPRNFVEYNWLSDTVAVPIMSITTNKVGTTETITAVSYRDDPKPIPISITPYHISERKAFPNPTSGKLTIESLTSSTPYTLYSITGTVVSEGITSGELDMTSLHSGIYFLTLHTTTAIEVLVIEKN